MTDRHSVQCKWWNAIDVFVNKKEKAEALSLSHHRSLAWNLDLDKDCQELCKDLLGNLISLVCWPEPKTWYTVKPFDQSHIFGPAQLNNLTLAICLQSGGVLKTLVGLSLHIWNGRSIKNSTAVLQGRMTVSRLHCLIFSFCSTFVCHQMVLRRNMFPVPPCVSCNVIISLPIEISYYLAGDTRLSCCCSILSCLVAF